MGWRPHWEQARSEAPGLTIGRVAIEYGGLYRVLVSEKDEVDDITAALPGKWRQVDPLDVPAVGDWVGLRGSGKGWAIEHRFQRKTQFLRQAAGRKTTPQVVGANVDVVFVVTSLDDDFNPRRIERYLAAILDGGAKPVIVLSKSDLSDDPDAARGDLGPSAVNVPIEIVSAKEGRGVDRLQAHLGRGRTGALTGSSGVGKSTLVNALVGEHIQRTQEVRTHDSKGRHTTTHRELILLGPDRGLLVDTPGMRELQLWTPGDGVAQAFDDLRVLAAQCRFRDCSHRHEPGCALREAVERGDVSQARVDSYLKLRREEAQLQARAARRKTNRRRR